MPEPLTTQQKVSFLYNSHVDKHPMKEISYFRKTQIFEPLKFTKVKHVHFFEENLAATAMLSRTDGTSVMSAEGTRFYEIRRPKRPFIAQPLRLLEKHKEKLVRIQYGPVGAYIASVDSVLYQSRVLDVEEENIDLKQQKEASKLKTDKGSNHPHDVEDHTIYATPLIIKKPEEETDTSLCDMKKLWKVLQRTFKKRERIKYEEDLIKLPQDETGWS